LQLYSVRTPIAEVGFAKVLEAVAEIGFKQVEFAGYTQGSSPEITVKELRALLDANGLVGVGSHVSPSDDASMQAILDDAEVLGLPQVGVAMLIPSGLPDTAGWRAAAEQYNRYAELASKRGLSFYMHNHFQEWLPVADDPSKRGIDVLLENTDPRFVHFEMDIYWAYVGRAQSGGGFDPLDDYAIPQRDRIKLFHVKDGRPQRNEILDVGEGEIDFQAFFTKLFAQSPDQAGRHMYLWERDSADDHPRGAFAAARSSYVNMRYGLVPAATADCPRAKGFDAVVGAVAFRRSESGRRRLHVTLKTSAPSDVTVTLTRGRRKLASKSTRLEAGTGTVALAVPRSVAAGPAKLKVSVAGDGGDSLTLRDRVRVPRRRR